MAMWPGATGGVGGGYPGFTLIRGKAKRLLGEGAAKDRETGTLCLYLKMVVMLCVFTLPTWES